MRRQINTPGACFAGVHAPRHYRGRGERPERGCPDLSGCERARLVAACHQAMAAAGIDWLRVVHRSFQPVLSTVRIARILREEGVLF